jgi:hypothetical protein
MNKLAVAALAATLSLAVAAPAVAQEHEGRHEGKTVKKVVIHRDHDRHHGWREGRHEGWRHHHGTKVVIKHGHGKTVIKKREG